MKTFTDAAGRTWTISLNLGTAMAVKDSLGIDEPASAKPTPPKVPLWLRRLEASPDRHVGPLWRHRGRRRHVAEPTSPNYSVG